MSYSMSRSTRELYRDCFRLIRHIAGNSNKGNKLRIIVRSEFKKNAKLNDVQLIESLKSNAIRGLSNYLMIESTAKDAKLQNKSDNYIQRESNSIKNNDNNCNLD